MLEGKAALITGAGSGIGRATALTLAREGASILVADINAAGAEAVASEIAASGGTAHPFLLDVSDEEGARAAVAEAKHRFGRLDILHNNAASVGVHGLTRRDQDIVGMDPGVWDGTMAVNLKGPMLMSKHAIPAMLETGGGSIVNTASISGMTGETDRFAYGASKAGLVALTRHIATRYGKSGIRCNAVAPGLIVTETIRKVLSPESLAVYRRHHLTPYLGEPEDVADLVAFLASDRSRFITGQVICVDGGLIAHAPMFADFSDQTGDGPDLIRSDAEQESPA